MIDLSWFRPALPRALRHGYRRTDFVHDLFAGLLVGVVALPLSMGLAIASGVSPIQGLYSAIVGGFIISLLGGSRMQIGGPAGAFVGLCAAGVAQFGPGGLAIATMLAGALMLLMGVARLGKAIVYIPTPVVIGFTTGIAVIIASTQLAPMLGISEPSKPFAHFHERLAWVWDHRSAIAWQPAAICAATMAIILVLRRVSARIPGALVAVLAVTVATALLGWEGDGTVATIGSKFGALSGWLPPPSLPSLGLPDGWGLTELINRLREIGGLVVAIALLGAIESLLSATVADGMSGDRHDSNTELVAQGVANLVSPLFSPLPCTGVIARTSTNIRAGARSPVAGILHAVTVLLILLALGSLVAHVPMAALAGVLLVVCWFMAEFRHWPHILKAGRSDAFLLPLAFCLTVFIDLTWAVMVGVILAMFFFVRRMSEATEVERQGAEAGSGTYLAVLPQGVEVYEIRGPFFFGVATLLRDIDAALGEKPYALVLRLRMVPFIDATAAFHLRELVTSVQRKGARVVLCELGPRALADLDRHGLAALVGDGGVQPDINTALAELARAAARAARG